MEGSWGDEGEDPEDGNAEGVSSEGRKRAIVEMHYIIRYVFIVYNLEMQDFYHVTVGTWLCWRGSPRILAGILQRIPLDLLYLLNAVRFLGVSLPNRAKGAKTSNSLPRNENVVGRVVVRSAFFCLSFFLLNMWFQMCTKWYH